MTRSKKIFIGVVLVFILGLIALVIDISRRTTFPGRKPSAKETQMPETRDSTDTAKRRSTPNSATQHP